MKKRYNILFVFSILVISLIIFNRFSFSYSYVDSNREYSFDKYDTNINSDDIDEYINKLDEIKNDEFISQTNLTETSSILSKGYYKLSGNLSFNKQFSSNLNEC